MDPLEWLDTDGDGTGNNADLDDDGDGVPDVDDPDPLDPTVPDLTDTDGDGVPDSQDPDIDGDGIPNELDDFPTHANESSDTDGDGIGDNADPDADNDGVLNEDDAFPFDDGETVDSDGGGLGDNADPDDDDDGVFDDVDVFPNDGTEWEDTDGDGTGNNADTDDDNDGVEDVDDAFPTDPTETLDTDFDGIGNNADPDDDNDGVLDDDDAFPLDSLVSKDTDGDGVGDLLDDDNDNDGALDLADAFPNDPAEQLDTDLDGVGNNADTDDDDDTFADTNDAFPLDPDEWADANGNGIGDNADAAADSDGDGELDSADPDIDGDLVDNGDDAFPYDPTEWADSDGDGIGDNEDTDDDDDGVPDEQDLLPNDPNTGTDSDGDGTPDTYDLDPNSADEPRFQVVTAEPSGAATTIVSDGLILEDEVLITEEPVDPQDGIANVAASEIVDFTIDGPYTEFETARITIPIDPTLAAQPDPVEVWWFNEEFGLWVPDGTDLQVDPAAATVSVTVDHFSKFIALRKNTRPIVVPPPGQCNDIGVDVLFLIDDSGSNEYSYIIDGQLVEASDPEVLISEPGQPTTTKTAERVEAARDVMLGLNEATDRVAVAGFSDVLDIQDLDYIGNSQAGYTSAITRVSQIADAPDSGGTDLVAALAEGRLLLEGEGSARANAIVVVSDGGAATYDFTQIRDAVGDNTIVHVVGLGNPPNPSLATVTQAGGGVFAENRASSEFATMLQRLDELKGDFGADSDGDLFTDCEELRGLMTPRAVGYGPAGSTQEFIPGGWVETDPQKADSDDDLLWDSEELVRVDLRDDPVVADTYGALIDAGLPEIVLVRGDPNDAADPIRSDGSLERAAFTSRFFPELQPAKNDRLAVVATALANPQISAPPTPLQVDALYALSREKVALQRAVQEIRPQAPLGYRDRILENLPETVKSVVEEDSDPDYSLAGDSQRLAAMWLPGSRDYNVSLGEQLLLAEINAETQLLLSPSISDRSRDAAIVRRDSRIRELMLRVPRNRNPSVTQRELVEQFEKLITYSTELEDADGETQIIRIQSAGAYRLLRLFNTSDAAFAFAVTDLISYLDYETGVAANSASDLGISEALHAQLTLELSVAQAQQISNFLNSEAPLSPFFTTAQDAAWRDLRGRFDRYTDDFEDGSVDDLTHGVLQFRAAVLSDQAPVVPSAGYPGVSSTAEPSILWADVFSEVTTSQTLMWDDIARSDLAASSWSGPFPAAGYLNEQIFNIQRSFTMKEFANEQSFSVNPSTHPGLITHNDMIQFGKVIAGYGFLGGFVEAGQLGDTVDGEIRISRKQLENFIESRVNSREFPEAVGEQMMQLVDAGLFDDVFDLDDVKRLLTGLGFAFVVAGGVVAVLATGPAGYFAAVALHAAGAAAESGVIAIDLVQGNIGSAYLGSLLLLVGGAGDVAAIYNRAADAAIAATRPTARVVAGGTDFADLPALLRQVDVPALDEYASVIETSSAGVLSSGQQAALSGFAIRSHLVDEFELLGVDPLLARSLANESVERLALELDAQNLAEYRALADQIDDVIDLRVATRFDPSELDDPALRSFVADCVGANSFSADTLVALADGTMLPIAAVQVGDQVLAYDFDIGETVAREVTATLPHEDWLLEAHLSDGSVITVTEDHRFWSITDDGWVELQDLDTDDVLLTPDGVTVTVDYLDWTAGETAPAWDLTVDQEHNFFVAADESAVPVLVHNASVVGLGCPDRISAAAAKRLQALSETDGLVSEATADALLSIKSRVVREGVSEAIGRAEDLATAALIAENAAKNLATTRTIAVNLPDVADVVLGGARYGDLVARNADVTREIVRSIRRGDLTTVEQSELARIMFDTDRGDVAFDYLTGIGDGRWDDFVKGFRDSERLESSSFEALGAWYLGTVKDQSTAWNWQERIDDGYRWTLPQNTASGQWQKINSGGLEADRVSGARANLRAADDNIAQTSNFLTGYGDLAALSNVDIRNAGEDFLVRVLDGRDVVERASITVRIAGRDEPFTFVPDFLELEGVVDGVARFRYLESKASRNGLPGVGQLTDNQAVFLDALRRGEVLSIDSNNSAFRAFVDAPGVDRAEIVGFRLYSFQLFS